jgi:hypothetical protein
MLSFSFLSFFLFSLSLSFFLSVFLSFELIFHVIKTDLHVKCNANVFIQDVYPYIGQVQVYVVSLLLHF